MKRPKLLGAIALLAVACAGVAVWIRVTSDTVTLSDGTRIRFLGYSLGAKQFSMEPPWKRMCRSILPARLQGWLPAEIPLPRIPAHLTVHLEIDPAPKPFGVTSAPFTLHAVSEDGFHYGEAHPFFGETTRVQSRWITGYPRRQTRFALVLQDRDGTPLRTFELENPTPPSTARWIPDRLPIRRTNGPVVLTLNGISWRSTNTWNPLLPDCSIATSDPTLAKVVPWISEVQDATGNRGRIVDPSEAAWGLTVRVQRSLRSQFSDAETIILTNLPIPQAGRFIPFECDGRPAGLTRVRGFIGGVGRLESVPNFEPLVVRTGMPLPPPPQPAGWTNDTPLLRLDLVGFPTAMSPSSQSAGSHRLVLTIHDDQGRKIGIASTSQQTASRSIDGVMDNRLTQESGLQIPADSKSLTVEINIAKPSIDFEFMIDPKVLRRADEPIR